MKKDFIKEIALGPEVVDGFCVSKSNIYCINCNGADVKNCPKSPEYKKL
ncbi:MAG: hypothetical protein QXD43_00520 [Candidatus Aenigmatarchaeota archaeon]